MQHARMEADGTLARAVFTAMKERFTDIDRAGDLMGVMNAMGMIYFSSIDAATEALVQRDLRVQENEAAWVVDACREAVARLEPVKSGDHQTVMVTQKTQAQKARATTGTSKGAKAPAQTALAMRSSLHDALQRKWPERKPKPRVNGTVNEALWKGAVATVWHRIENKHDIVSLENHYRNMCDLGKGLLVNELHREAQGLYDYRAGKLLYRASRRTTK